MLREGTRYIRAHGRMNVCSTQAASLHFRPTQVIAVSSKLIRLAKLGRSDGFSNQHCLTRASTAGTAATSAEISRRLSSKPTSCEIRAACTPSHGLLRVYISQTITPKLNTSPGRPSAFSAVEFSGGAQTAAGSRAHRTRRDPCRAALPARSTGLSKKNNFQRFKNSILFFKKRVFVRTSAAEILVRSADAIPIAPIAIWYAKSAAQPGLSCRQE